MNLHLNDWKKDWALMTYFFNADEIEKIKASLKNLSVKHIVFCSFENRFAKSGGLAAVTTTILPYLKEATKNMHVILITPFYSKIIDESKLKQTGINFDVSFGDKTVTVEILEYTWEYREPQKGSLKEYYLKANQFFDSENRLNDPYIYDENDRKRNDEKIRENALFFSLIVPRALKVLNIQENIVFHLQDWETALISLTSKEALLHGILKSCGTVITMHNPFDSFISWDLFGKIVEKKRIPVGIAEGLTAYEIGLPLVDAPITTVSENFAKEFTDDVLQTEHFAPHLQRIFKSSGVIGINNGMFVNFPKEFSVKESHTISNVKKLKSEKRKALLKILDEYHPKERFGDLTYQRDSITNLPENVPIFVMSGRLDPVQKGYDIFLRAIERFFEDEIKVILTPMPIKSSDLDYFYEIAGKCKGNVTVFPIRMQKGFHELQIGSTYGLMPSIYEPFGAAIEYMVNGTVNIARSTGGLLDQIDDQKCGILFRENNEHYNLKNIKQFSESSDLVQSRRDNTWVVSMVEKLYQTLIAAIDLYQNHQQDYFKMIIQGFEKARTFDWKVSAGKYHEIYERVNSGF